MKNITRTAITKLVHNDGLSGPFVTIYAPMHRAATSPNMTEDQIRLKNLIHKAVTMLKERPNGQTLANRLCDRLELLKNDKDFWEQQTEGLLLCAEGETVHLFHLPIDTEEYVAVDDQYHLAAALALLSDEQSYYVLTVSQHRPVLLKGDGFDIQATDIILPQSVESALNLDEPNQKSEQQRSNGGASSSSGGFNGRGGARDPRSADRLRFWRLVDQKMLESIDKKLPLILAGTGSEIAEFRSVSHHLNILDDCIEGSFAGSVPHDLLQPAMAIIGRNVTSPEHAGFIEEYTRLSGANPERVASRAEDISTAAGEGRIETLLLGIHRRTTDTVGDNLTPVPTISFPGSNEQEATANHIAQQVFETSGKVIAIEQEAMPGHALVLARLRY